MIIKRRAIREDTGCREAFRKLFLKNYGAWLSFAQEELQTDISLRDMLLVTGNILTNEWATATIVEKTRNCEITFNAGDEASPFGGASASMWGSWNSSVSLPLRFGPTSLPPIISNAHTITSISDSSNTSDTPATGPTETMIPDHEQTTGPPCNQCIFVRAYRMLLRPFSLRKIKAAAEPKDEGGGESDQESLYPVAVRVELDSNDNSEAENGDDDLERPVSIVVMQSNPLLSVTFKALRYFRGIAIEDQ